jgi:hypothetical protein
MKYLSIDGWRQAQLYSSWQCSIMRFQHRVMPAARLSVVFVQVNLVGKAQTSYLPGVLVPEVNAGGAAELAGFKAGDIILRVGDYEVPATNRQVRFCWTSLSHQQWHQGHSSSSSGSSTVYIMTCGMQGVGAWRAATMCQ